MRRLFLAAALVLAPAAAHAFAKSPTLDLTPGPNGLVRCAAPRVSADEAISVQDRLDHAHGRASGTTFRLTIPIAFHVITCGGQGNVPQSQIDAQVRALNDAYRQAGFSFTLASVDRTDNCQWFSNVTGPGVEKKMKQALAIDPAHRLNVYTADLGHNLLGWAYYPQSLPEGDALHGVVIHYATLPGGTLAPYNLGGTLQHETGHYLGLYHTFQGGCTAPGDYCDDTPFEAGPAFGCPEGRNTCAQPGDDPIHDYMDYTDDACYTLFTTQQALRMQDIVTVYRPSLFTTTAAAMAAASSPFATLPATGAARPGAVAFAGAWPNPFADETMLRFALPKAAHVTLELSDVAGRRVAVLLDGELTAGEQSVALHADGLRPGMYFAALRTGSTVISRAVVLAP